MPFQDVPPHFYNQIFDHSSRRQKEAPLFGYLASLVLTSLPAVDLACGPGFHLEQLCQDYSQVIARDLSPEMVAYAKQEHSQQSITWRVCDMCAPCMRPAGLLLNLGNSLSLLPDSQALGQFFQAASRSLATGGLLVTQTLNYANLFPAEAKQKCATIERSYQQEALKIRKQFTEIGPKIRLDLQFTYQNTDYLSSSTLLPLTSCKLKETASHNKLQLVAEFGGPDLSKPSPTAPNYIGIWQKQR